MWLNPPFSAYVKTHIDKRFVGILIKHFPICLGFLVCLIFVCLCHCVCVYVFVVFDFVCLCPCEYAYVNELFFMPVSLHF
jgi:hypothetical protein